MKKGDLVLGILILVILSNIVFATFHSYNQKITIFDFDSFNNKLDS